MDESEYEQDLDFNAKPSLVFDTLELKKGLWWKYFFKIEILGN